MLILSSLACTAGRSVENRLSAGVHFQGADPSETGSVQCPEYVDSTFRCDITSETYYGGTIEDPTNIPISKWGWGQIQLNGGVYISHSEGLEWFDQEGNSVEIEEMEQGVFYTYCKTSISGSFDLVQP